MRNIIDISTTHTPSHFISAHDKLALFGGEPTIPVGIVRPWPAAEQAHEEPLKVVIESGRYHRVNHPVVSNLEQNLSVFAGGRRARAVGSGTAAIHIAVDHFKQKGLEIVTAALNWPGAVGPIAVTGAEPVFVDVNLVDAALDEPSALAALGERTGSVLITHLFGGNIRCPRLRDAARAADVALIDDVCQSIGALQNIQDGHLLDSDALALSGNGAKHLGAGELGLLITDNDDLIDHVDRVSLTSSSRNGERVFSPDTLGLNYRPNVFSASLANARLLAIEEQLSARRQNSHRLWREVSACAGLLPLFDTGDLHHSFLNFPLRIDLEMLELPAGPVARDVIVEALRAEGVPVWVWLTKPVFEYLPAYRGQWTIDAFPNTKTLLDTMFYVSEIAPPNGTELMKSYGDAFRKVWAALPQLRSEIHHRLMD